MANRKVVDLPELTTMSNDDELYIVDISDLSESSEGTSKKIKASNFVPAGGELIANKQNSLTSDGTGIKYPTVDAVNFVLTPESTRLDSTHTDIYAWGDSLTAGTGGTPYPTTLSDLTYYTITNRGVGGESSTQIKDRFIAETAAYAKSVIIWSGRNNYTSPSTVKADIATMVSALGHTRYLVLSILNANISTEWIGTTNYNTITQLNGDLKSIYGDKYVDVRKHLVGLQNGSTQDLIDFANDVTPTSLRSDLIHLNTAGYTAVAEYLNTKLGILFNQNSYLQAKDIRYYSQGSIHTTGNESFTGVKSSTNTGSSQINGFLLTNSGTGNSASYIANSTSSGIGFRANNSSGGIGFYTNNTSYGNAFFANNVLDGNGFYSNNTSSGRGFYSDNLSSGRGYYVNNSANGQGVYIDNTGTSRGLYVNNTGTGSGIISNGSTASVGYVFVGQNNSSNTFLVNKTGDVTCSSIIVATTPATSAGTYDILTRNTSTGVVEKVLSNTIAKVASPSFTGTPTAPTATAGTNTTQIATTAFVQAAKTYKVYTALVSQTGTSAPTAIVLENTLGGTVVWTRVAQGSYVATLSSAFVLNKTAFISTSSNSSTIVAGGYATTSTVAISTSDGGVSFDGLMSNSFIEIRVYN